jgi:DNA polymerase-3 subunit alpha
MKLEVHPPSINASDYMFRAQDAYTVVYGLGAIKGVGQAAIDAMLAERGMSGPFKDLFDFCRRVDSRRVNRRTLEALIRAGCFDCLGMTRASALAQLPMAVQAADQASRDVAVGQEDMFGLTSASESVPADAPVLPEWEESERLSHEKDVLGLYLTGHPITQYEPDLAKIVNTRLGSLGGAAEPTPRRRKGGRPVTIAGLVVAIRTRNTQSGNRMAFLTLDDRTGRIECAVFTEAYKQFRHLLLKDSLLVVHGSLDYDDFIGGLKVTAEKVMDIDEARMAAARRVRLRIDSMRLGADGIDELKRTLEPYRGGACPIMIDYRAETAKGLLMLGEDWRVRPSDDLLHRLRALLGPEAVELEY